MQSITIDKLENHPDLRDIVSQWFEDEWPEYYGVNGIGNAREDVKQFSTSGTCAPFGLLAFYLGVPCGFMALKSEPFASCPELGPWLGAAYVQPHLRRHGIGAALVEEIEKYARLMAYPKIFCATASADGLMLRAGWLLLEEVLHQGKPIRIYEVQL